MKNLNADSILNKNLMFYCIIFIHIIIGFLASMQAILNDSTQDLMNAFISVGVNIIIVSIFEVIVLISLMKLNNK